MVMEAGGLGDRGSGLPVCKRSPEKKSALKNKLQRRKGCGKVKGGACSFKKSRKKRTKPEKEEQKTRGGKKRGRSKPETTEVHERGGSERQASTGTILSEEERKKGHRA